MSAEIELFWCPEFPEILYCICPGDETVYALAHPEDRLGPLQDRPLVWKETVWSWLGVKKGVCHAKPNNKYVFEHIGVL
jgi:hypothetical protein